MQEAIIQDLTTLLGKSKVLYGSALKTRYVHIWKMDDSLEAIAVLLPETTEEVSEIMKICTRHKQSICLHGGLTNLVGATETQQNDIVISFEKMNNVLEVDPAARTITVQAGVILEEVQNAATENDLLFPLNFGAKGSAQMGGIIATNAGGLRVFKFGMTRNLVLGLEVVLADGTILSSLKKIIKDNSAYDLKQMFIGSEGTLGLITKAVLKLQEKPKSRNSAFIAFDEYDKIIAFLKYLDGSLAGTLSGFELIWQDSYLTMTSEETGVKPPLPGTYNYYVLVESLGADQDQDRAKMERVLAQAMEKDLFKDAAMAFTESDLKWFWGIREDVHALVKTCEYDQHFDVSIPIAEIGKYVERTRTKLEQLDFVNQIYAFGHMADGNIHFIIGKNSNSISVKEQINAVVYEEIQALGGSVSAEHGIGLHKKAYLRNCRSEAEIKVMQLLKKTLDPNNILNKSKIFDLED